MPTRLYTAEQIRTLDDWAVHVMGIPPEILMENAGEALVAALGEFFGDLKGKAISILCGKGRNGGDGMVAARLLHALEAKVLVFLTSPPGKLFPEAAAQLDLCRKSGLTVHLCGDTAQLEACREMLQRSDLIVDALLGTGSRGALTGYLAEVVHLVNDLKVPIAAVDIPSGLDASSGQVEGACVKASLCVTFIGAKLGLWLYPGAAFTGKVVVAGLGLPPAPEVQGPRCYINDGLQPWVPQRPVQAHKKNVGSVLVVAGSGEYSGAVILAGLGAFRSGAGMVHLACPAAVAQALAGRLPEAILHPIGEATSGAFTEADAETLLKLSQDCQAVVIGQGLGTAAGTVSLVRKLWDELPLPTVFDADALNALASAPFSQSQFPRVLTPHSAEMARLASSTAARVDADRPTLAATYAANHKLVLCLKGPHTLIAAPEGEIYLNLTGNPGLATAGTGDVLAGAIAGLLSQGLPPLEAARLGVHAHGLSGDLCAAKGQVGMMASDVANRLPEALQAIGSLPQI